MAERTILNSVSGIDVYNTSLSVSLNISVNDASVTHSLAIKRGSTTITTSTFGALSVGTQTKIVSLTSAQRTAILNAMPDVASFNATYELTSLNNGVVVGTPSAASAVIKLSNGYPTVADFTWADTNPKTLAMTGDSHYIIEGESDLYFYNVSATPYTGASIAQYILGDGLSDKNLRTTTGGTIHYGTVAPIYAFDPESIGDIFVLAQDTRRREKSKSSTRTGWSYYDRPWNSSVTVTRNASDASLIDIHLSGKFHLVNGLNWMTASFKYKLSSESTYSTDISLPVTTSGNSYSCDAIGLTGLNSSAFSEASQYDIVVTASDALHDNSQSFVLPSISPMIAFRDDAVGFGVVPQGTKRVEIAQDWSLVANGKSNQIPYMPYSWECLAQDSSSGGYIRVCTLTIGANNVRTPIVFEIQRRSEDISHKLTLSFAQVANTDPDVGSFVYEGSSINAFVYKTATSTWDLYVAKNTAYERLTARMYLNGWAQRSGGITATHADAYLSSVPSGATMATPVSPDATTPTLTRSSGNGSITNARLQKQGALCLFTLQAVNGSSQLAAGSNAWVGSTTVPKPIEPISACGYSGESCIVAYLDTAGTLTIRVTGTAWAANYDSSRIALTYFTAE